MVITKRIQFDRKTGKTKTDSYDFIEKEPFIEPKGVNFDKLKEVLKSKGIIANFSEIE